MELLNNEERLQEARQRARALKQKFSEPSLSFSSDDFGNLSGKLDSVTIISHSAIAKGRRNYIFEPRRDSPRPAVRSRRASVSEAPETTKRNEDQEERSNVDSSDLINWFDAKPPPNSETYSVGTGVFPSLQLAPPPTVPYRPPEGFTLHHHEPKQIRTEYYDSGVPNPFWSDFKGGSPSNSEYFLAAPSSD